MGGTGVCYYCFKMGEHYIGRGMKTVLAGTQYQGPTHLLMMDIWALKSSITLCAI